MVCNNTYRYRIVSSIHDGVHSIRPDDDILIASKASLSVKKKVFRTRSESNRDNFYFVIDEAHHAPAKGYRDFIADMRKLFTEAHMEAAYNRIIRDSKFDIDGAGDVAALIAENHGRNMLIVSQYVANAAKLGKTLVFALNQAMAELLCKYFQAAGVKAGCVVSNYGAVGGTEETYIVDFLDKWLDDLVALLIPENLYHDEKPAIYGKIRDIVYDNFKVGLTLTSSTLRRCVTAARPRPKNCGSYLKITNCAGHLTTSFPVTTRTFDATAVTAIEIF